MTVFEARYYDGKSSQLRKVSIYPLPPDRLHVLGEGVDFSCTLAEIRASSRVGNTRRHLYFADGSQCETADNDAVDEILASANAAAPGRLLHRWESRLGYVLFALVLTAVSLWAGVVYGIPALAKQVAFSLPAATDRMLGQGALEGLDKTLLRQTRLSPQRQSEVKALFDDMKANIEDAGDYRLELRASKMIGANAFALPSGIVVVTDPLVRLAKSDGELVAVLAHEIGHLRQRHGLRRALQGSAMAVVVIAVTGDVGSLVSVTAALPALLVESKYSRDFEREADDFALDYLQRHDIAPEAMGEILLRMGKQVGAAGDVPDFLSSHPATRERAERSRVAR
ncbi:MAG: M48 family metallopeptidase [Burkholderiaceae bacterium]|nr:M48 family metallopeptidase [Burkholderiaceae bacterium]